MLVSHVLPVVRTFIALPAGVARMPMARFQIDTFVRSWPWCFGLAYVGAVLRDKWNSDPVLRTTFHRFDAAVALLAVLTAGLFRMPPSARVEAKGVITQPPSFKLARADCVVLATDAGAEAIGPGAGL